MQREDVPQVIRAHSFEVIGDSSRVAAKMGDQISNGGEAVLRILSEQGHGLKLVGDDGGGAGGRIETIDNGATVIASWP